MKSQSFEQLIVWQKAHSYVLAIYKITKQYPSAIFAVIEAAARRIWLTKQNNSSLGYCLVIL